MKDVGLGSSFKLVFLGFGFLKHGCGAVHFTLRLLHINGIRLLKVVHQHRELVGIHSSKASHNNHRLPFSIFLKAKHTGVQSRHHWCVIGQNAQLAGSTWQDHLRAGHCHAISFWWQDLVGRTKWPLWDVAIGETTCYTWYTSYTCDMTNLLWFSSEKKMKLTLDEIKKKHCRFTTWKTPSPPFHPIPHRLQLETITRSSHFFRLFLLFSSPSYDAASLCSWASNKTLHAALAQQNQGAKEEERQHRRASHDESRQECGGFSLRESKDPWSYCTLSQKDQYQVQAWTMTLANRNRNQYCNSEEFLKTKTKKTLQLGSNRPNSPSFHWAFLSSKKLISTASGCLLALCSSSWCWSSHLRLSSCQLLWPQAKAKIHHCLGEGPTVWGKGPFGWWVFCTLLALLGWRDAKKDPGTLSRPPYKDI